MKYLSEAFSINDIYPFEQYLSEHELQKEELEADEPENLMEDYFDELHKLTKDLVYNSFDSNALCMDISELNDSISKTFLYLIAPVFNYFRRNKENITYINAIMKECIPEWEKIIHMLDGRLCLLYFIVCMTDREKRFWIYDPFKLYNQGIALVHFKKMDEDIQLISTGSGMTARQDNLLLLERVQETVTFWNYGLVSVLWENYGYKYSSKYGMAVLNNGYLQHVIQMFRSGYSIFAENFYAEIFAEKTSDIIDMFYLFSKHEIDLKCNSLRIQYAQLAYMYSPFVEESRKKDIAVLFDILWRITCDCEIARVYIEENEYKPRKKLCEVGRMDRTTRVHIIFSLKNNDIYSLRIDMPHKDVEYVHINLQEIKGEHVVDSAMPVMDNEAVEEIKELLKEKINQYFYESGEELWWFRIGFLDKIVKIEDEVKVHRLKEIFEHQRHFEVKITNDGYELFNDFKYYLKMYLSKSVQINQPFEIGEEIVKYRCVLWSRDMLEQLFLDIGDDKKIDEKINLYMKTIKKELLSVEKGFSAKEFNELTWRDILELLMEEFWNG